MNSNTQEFINIQESYEALKDYLEMPINNLMEKYYDMDLSFQGNSFHSIPKTDE